MTTKEDAEIPNTSSVENMPGFSMNFELQINDNDKDITSKKKRARGPSSVISNDVRKMIIDAIENGMCTRKTAASTFNVPYQKVVSIYNRFLKTGAVNKKIRTVFRHKLLDDEQTRFIIDCMEEDCSLKGKDLQAKLLEKYNIQVSTSTINQILKSFYFSIKRNQVIITAVITPQRIVDCKLYCEQFVKYNNSGRAVIFFEKTEFNVKTRQLCGKIHGRQSDEVIIPTLRIRNKVIMAALRKDELFYYRGEDESEDQLNYLTFITDFIAELIARDIAGAVLIMDKASLYNRPEIRELIRVAGHELLLIPSYSPSLSPVESFFAHWESLLRAVNPANQRALEELIFNFKDVVGKEYCNLYWQHVIDNVTRCLTDVDVYV